jgi:hypothetical protein
VGKRAALAPPVFLSLIAMAEPQIEVLHASPPERTREILGLFHTAFGLELSEQHWQWKYGGLPGSHRFHVLALLGGQPIGHVGALVQPAWASGSPGLAPAAAWMAHLTDVMVHPAHRGGLGPDGIYPTIMTTMATHLSRWQAQTRRPLYAYGFPGLTPSRLGHRMGLYRPLFRVQEYALNTTAPGGWLWRLRHVPGGPLSEGLRQELDDLDRRAAPVPSVTGTADAHIPPRLRKDGAYVEWRYALHPARPYRMFLLRSPMGRLRGWCVLRIAPQPKFVDLCTDDPCLRPRLVAAASSPPGSAQGGTDGQPYSPPRPRSPAIPWRTWIAQDAAGPGEPSLIVPVEFRVPGSTHDWPAPAFAPGDTDVF